MLAFRRLIDAIEAEGSAALVTLARAEGSSPRESGARMVVRPSGGFLAQCCGGRVEWRIETFDLRDLADLAPIAGAESRGLATLSAHLGPDGRVERKLAAEQRGEGLTASLPAAAEWIEPLGQSARSVYLFGAGHVGRALALALAPLPFAVRWIDSRLEAFPAYAPANVALIHAVEPTAELTHAPDGALIVVMTHSHAIDLEIVAEALRSERFGYVGLIGSATKRARFLSQMRSAKLSEVQLAKLVCPIGVSGVEGKDPAVIAASTTAQLLMVSERLAAEGLSGPAR
jgi:xanthine dehydrogenase accessory factor